jgi:threonine synthase
VRYHSTRSTAPTVDFHGALLRGLAPDGGLYVPESIPALPDGWEHWSYAEAVAGSLALFGAEDSADLAAEAAATFTHPEVAPLVEVGDRLVLELFWGPTLSFKDHALQVVARLLRREAGRGVVLVATSGDTGSAAIEACRGSLPIVVLFPEGRVAELQRRQMTTVDDPDVSVLAVRGTFDQCQAMVKEALATVPGLLAVNSINFARVAAQVGYYIYVAARIGEPFGVVVPTGNFGNAYSCWMARQMGAPIEQMVIANNANHDLADLMTTGAELGSEVVATVAPAMDIQRPSNLERLPVEARAEFGAGWAGDEEIKATIAIVDRAYGYLLDPHTATAWKVAGEHPSDHRQLVVSTAHPAKFSDVVEEASGRRPELPERLGVLTELPERYTTIDPSHSELIDLIGGG